MNGAPTIRRIGTINQLGGFNGSLTNLRDSLHMKLTTDIRLIWTASALIGLGTPILTWWLGFSLLSIFVAYCVSTMVCLLVLGVLSS